MSIDAGIDPALKMLGKIKDHAEFLSSGAKPLELFKSGEVSMSIACSGRVFAAVYIYPGTEFSERSGFAG